MPHKFNISWCPICDQGWVTVLKKPNNQYCVSCEECYSSWESPQDITSKEKSFLLLDQKDVSEVTLEEIKALGWEKHLADL